MSNTSRKERHGGVWWTEKKNFALARVRTTDHFGPLCILSQHSLPSNRSVQLIIAYYCVVAFSFRIVTQLIEPSGKGDGTESIG